VAYGRNPHSDRPVRVASWPAGPDWPPPDKKDKKASRNKKAASDQPPRPSGGQIPPAA
jgi:hypothetical protein